jgi:site-specific recombinase XerD
MEPANKGQRYPAEPLTDDEVRTLLGTIKGNRALAVRNRALVAVLWGSGLRVSEALSLMPRDVNGDALRIRHGKGDQARVVGLRSDAAPYLAAWLDCRSGLGLNGRQPVFCSVADGSRCAGVRQVGQPLDPSYVRRLLPKLADRAGIDKRVHAHGLRHSHATGLVERGAALHTIAGQLGHASTATTDTYLAKIAPEQRLEALRRAWESVDVKRPAY